MSDLISVSSLLKNSAQIEFANTDGTVGMYINVKAVKLEQQYNSIDAVEVVRCKDCKYYKTELCENQDNHEDWFCADGERKENVKRRANDDETLP